MKKLIISFASIALVVSFTGLFSCQSAEQKVDDAQDELMEAKQDLEEASTKLESDTQPVLSAEEWKEFKAKSEQKIMDYENRISELKKKTEKSGKLLETYYEQRIINLENKVVDLRTKLISQEKTQSNWETFKREFNHDLDELGKAISNFVEDDKK